ncbi:MAG: FMN-binding protein [Limimaricola sp.]|uniref:FMN-binding protein n=1 Tax=Limimaricola sp. TaxID=2211665 RepID=UPI001D6C8601|nr:FMN-binding protein [Limimaricola sp.]MBI1417502.1 FMN-binding protein [Limimaricola sp.]
MKINSRTLKLAVSATALATIASAASAGFLWDWNPAPAQIPAPQPAQAITSGSLRDGSYTGPSIYQYYGYVQVKLNIRNGSISSVDILRYPNDYSTSVYINTHALPILESELIQAQSLRISGVSGATLTSEAFAMSAQGALKKATS